MRWSAAATVGLALACQRALPSEAERHHADREAYVASLTRPADPNACAPIEAAGLRSECLAMVASQLSDQGRLEAASALCADLEPGRWQDECRFLVAEKADAPTARRRQLCDASGAFAQQCRGHLLRQESAQLLGRFALGEEEEAFSAVLALSRDYLPRRARAQARRLMVEHLAARAPTRPFGREHCGAAPQDLCVSVYTDRVQMAARREHHQTRDLDALDALPWQPMCEGAPTLSRAASLGLPTWDPELNPVVQAAWDRLCGRSEPDEAVKR